MKTKLERFADFRFDRLCCYPRYQRRAILAQHKEIAIQFKTQFKNVRLDKRFAGVVLAHDLIANGLNVHRYMHSHIVSMSAHYFPEFSTIPTLFYIGAAAHQSLTDKNKIACYPTRADAARQREVVMSPGKFFQSAGILSAHSVQHYAEHFASAVNPPEVFFATDAGTWSRVYATPRGFNSCMGGDWTADNLNSPVRAYCYEGNNLALAYMAHNDDGDDGECVARSIVNTERKTYMRVYGDARLKTALQALGYSECMETLRGEKLAARLHNNKLIAPYLDGAISAVSWDGSSDYMTVSGSGDIECRETSGFAQWHEDSRECENCGDSYHEDEGMYSEHHEMSICAYCADNHFVTAWTGRRDRDLVREDETVCYLGDYYLNDSHVLELHNLCTTHDGEIENHDDCVFLEYMNEWVLASECVELSIAHGEDTYAMDCDTKTITLDGEEKIVHEDHSGPEDEETLEETA